MTDDPHKFAGIWVENEDAVKNQMTSLLIYRLEKGFKNKDIERGYRIGLAEIAHLWSECAAQVEKEKRDAENLRKIEENKNKQKSIL